MAISKLEPVKSNQERTQFQTKRGLSSNFVMLDLLSVGVLRATGRPRPSESQARSSTKGVCEGAGTYVQWRFAPIINTQWRWVNTIGNNVVMSLCTKVSKVAASRYNLFHHKALAIAVGVARSVLQNNELMLAGILLFGHSSMDRLIGAGLKHTTGFADTHLNDVAAQTEPRTELSVA